VSAFSCYPQLFDVDSTIIKIKLELAAAGMGFVCRRILIGYQQGV
jgi:hypothetical protein